MNNNYKSYCIYDELGQMPKMPNIVLTVHFHGCVEVEFV